MQATSELASADLGGNPEQSTRALGEATLSSSCAGCRGT